MEWKHGAAHRPARSGRVRPSASGVRSGSPAASQGRRPSAAPLETVSPRWLLRAFLASVAVALLCGYLTFCFLFVQGEWQLVLHPTRPGAALPAQIGTAVTETVHFAVDSSGRPQLAGVWLPADAVAPYRHLTLLYLPPGDGSLGDAAGRLAALHRLGLPVFALDYRGYGQSAAGHPSQRSMESDADAALTYLLDQRHAAPDHVVLYGDGVGAYLAARLAAQHPAIPALILDGPRYDIVDGVRRDPRVRLLPVGLLFHETFALEPLLARLTTPKLILWRAADPPAALRYAAEPRMTVSLSAADQIEFPRALTRFLDQYAPHPPPASVVPQKAF